MGALFTTPEKEWYRVENMIPSTKVNEQKSGDVYVLLHNELSAATTDGSQKLRAHFSVLVDVAGATTDTLLNGVQIRMHSPIILSSFLIISRSWSWCEDSGHLHDFHGNHTQSPLQHSRCCLSRWEVAEHPQWSYWKVCLFHLTYLSLISLVGAGHCTMTVSSCLWRASRATAGAPPTTAKLLPRHWLRDGGCPGTIRFTWRPRRLPLLWMWASWWWALSAGLPVSFQSFLIVIFLTHLEWCHFELMFHLYMIKIPTKSLHFRNYFRKFREEIQQCRVADFWSFQKQINFLNISQVHWNE